MSLQRGDANPVLRQKLPWNASSAKVSPDARKLIYSVAEGATSTVYMSVLGWQCTQIGSSESTITSSNSIGPRTAEESLS